MKDGFMIIIGIVLINYFILLYEKQGQGKGWRIYFGLLGIILIGAISLPIGLLLLIPITLNNLLWNTKRLRGYKNNGDT